MSTDDKKPSAFYDVLARELSVIRASRNSRSSNTAAASAEDEDAPASGAQSHGKSQFDDAWEEGLVGVAFSGGGIRSATFNLGFIQSLAKIGLLKRIDYLSTVSGGGYIGAWLSALLSRAARSADSSPIRVVETTIRASTAQGQQFGAVAHLRNFSNYLTPKLGMFSADTWSALTTYLRNLFLNIPMILGALAVVILGVRLMQYLLVAAVTNTALDWSVPLLVGVFVLVAAWGLTRNMAAFPAPGETSPDQRSQTFDTQTKVILTVVLPAVLASAVASVWLPTIRPHELAPAWFAERDYLSAALAVGLAGSLIWIAAWLRALRSQMFKLGIAWVLTALVSGFVAGFALWWLTCEVLKPLSADLQVVFGPPLLLGWATAQGFLQIGLLGGKLPDEQREWLSRLGGWLFIGAFAWVLIFGLAYFGHLLIMSVGPYVKLGLGGGWLATGIAAGFASRGTGDDSGAKRAVRRLIVALAPYVFIIGLIAILTAGLNIGLLRTAAYLPGDSSVSVKWEKMREARSAFFDDRKAIDALSSSRVDAQVASLGVVDAGNEAVRHATTYRDIWAQYQVLYQASQDWRAIIIWILLSTLVFGVLSWRVRINGFSLSRFYANRLVRCYVGASVSKHERNATTNPFTNFSQADDLCVADAKHDGPYHIVNMAINLVAGDNLAWQERKAGPFFVTRDFYGFALADGRADLGYFRATSTNRNHAAGWTLGEAIATSGAAASPNMGYRSTPAFAFLLTLLNVRLGRWIGNPNHPRMWSMPSPSFTVWYLLMELFGLTKANSKFVYLSDGGHFDNLGIYELVRRQARYIIACDVGADANFNFEDLGNVIRKCRSDLGVDIRIDVKELRERNDRGFCRQHCAIGEVHYPGGNRGTLVYIKSSLTGDEPEDVLNYANRDASFPHQPTSDQFFSESQFESYRSLGEHIGDTVLSEAAVVSGGEQLNVETFFLTLRQYWHAPARPVSDTSVEHSHRLDQIYERLRLTPTLAYLDRHFYPELRVFEQDGAQVPADFLKLPEDPLQLREGFYLCNALLQLMQDIYRDLGLEGDWQHPNNAGWMNLFKHWSWTPMFRATWSICASTYGNRFQTFCERRLDMRIGKVFVQPLRLHIDSDGELQISGASVTLNFLERAQIKAIIADLEPRSRSEYGLSQLDLLVESGMPDLHLLQFNFGYCLTRGDQLVVFRIQDHLRKTGLGRKSLECLLAHSPMLTAPAYDELPEAIRALAPGEAGEDSWHHFVRLLRSVRRQLGLSDS